MVPRLWPPRRDAGRDREAGGWAPRREATLEEGRAGEDRGRPYQLVQLAVRIEALALIAWWPAEVLNNGLVDCYSHYRGGLHLPGSRPSAPRTPLLPRAAQRAAAVRRPSPCPCAFPRAGKAGSGPTWPQPGQAKVIVTSGPRPLSQVSGSLFPLPRPLISHVAELWVFKLLSPGSTRSGRGLSEGPLPAPPPLAPRISARDQRGPCPESSSAVDGSWPAAPPPEVSPWLLQPPLSWPGPGGRQGGLASRAEAGLALDFLLRAMGTHRRVCAGQLSRIRRGGRGGKGGP